MKRVPSFALLALALAASPVASQPAAPCTDPAYRQFDFWAGEWDVFKPDGTLAGRNRIEKQYADCVLHEHYATPAGYSGESLNTYDAARRVWHQTWVDNTGMVLQLDGGMVDGRMVLEGVTPARDGPATRHRITWTPNPDGSVRQFWESTDAKGEWTVAFDGLYKRRTPQP